MLDEDSFTVQMNENQALLETQLAVSSYISLQRQQKLDLLTHLISNIGQSFVIYGPHKVGKSRLLTEFRQAKKHDSLIVSIQSTVDLSFDAIEKQILDFLLALNPGYKYQTLSASLLSLQKRCQKIVVLIDNAGLLLPGLVSSLIKYAVESGCISFVFSLTEEQLGLKRHTDEFIADCHFIAVAPLTENQCADLLHELAIKNGLAGSSKFIIEKFYQKTQGLPGKIVTETARFADYRKNRNIALLIAGLMIIIAIVGIKTFIGDDLQTKLNSERIKIVLDLKPLDLSASVVSEGYVDEKVQAAKSGVINDSSSAKKHVDPSVLGVKNIVVDEDENQRQEQE